MQLEAKDVDFSTQSIKQLELMHKQETYPPRITMTFDTTLAPQQTLTVRIQVEGTYRDKQLSVDLLLPFVNNGKFMHTMSYFSVPGKFPLLARHAHVSHLCSLCPRASAYVGQNLELFLSIHEYLVKSGSL